MTARRLRALLGPRHGAVIGISAEVSWHDQRSPCLMPRSLPRLCDSCERFILFRQRKHNLLDGT